MSSVRPDPRKRRNDESLKKFKTVVNALVKYLDEAGDQLGTIINIDVSIESSYPFTALVAQIHLYEAEKVLKLCKKTTRRGQEVRGSPSRHIQIFALDPMASPGGES